MTGTVPDPAAAAPDDSLILRAYPWKSNAHLIADVARLGYFTVTDGRGKRRVTREAYVLDVTYGVTKDGSPAGGWWKRYRPERLDWHDLGLDGVDYCRLPEADDTYDVVAYDPGYVGVGGVETSTIPDFQGRYGIARKSRRPDDVRTEIIAGLREVHRVLRPGGLALMKGMNYVEGGRYRTVASDVVAFATAPHLPEFWTSGLSMEVVDEFVHLSGVKAQPPCRTCRGRRTVDARDAAGMTCPKCGGSGRHPQQHSRANYSMLYALRKARP